MKLDADGTCGLEDVIYHAVRCGLFHAGDWGDTLRFEDRLQIIVGDDSKLVLPSTLVKGLILAVVTSPANASETIEHPYQVSFGIVSIPLNKLWGKRNELLALRDANLEVQRALQAFN